MNILEIAAGWKNAINYDRLSPELKVLIDSRSKICIACPELSINRFEKPGKSNLLKILENLAGIQPNELTGITCGKCGCGMNAKVSSPLAKCPLGKW